MAQDRDNHTSADRKAADRRTFLREVSTIVVAMTLFATCTDAFCDDCPHPLLSVVEAVQDTPLSENDQARAKQLLDAAWKHGEAITSGRFTGTVTLEDARDKGNKRHLATVECFVDFARQRYRYDRVQNGLEVRFVSTPRETLRWHSDQRRVYKEAEGDQPSTMWVMWSFDPRCISWLPPEQQTGVGHRYSLLRNERFAAASVVQIEEIDDMHVELRWLPDPRVMVSITLDKTREHLPVCMGQRYLEGGRFVPRQSVTTTWKSVDEILVPVRVDSRTTLSQASVHTVELDWEKANPPLSGDDFCLKGMHVPSGAQVWELINGKFVMRGRVDLKGDIIESRN